MSNDRQYGFDDYGKDGCCPYCNAPTIRIRIDKEDRWIPACAEQCAKAERARIVKWGRSANAVIAILNTALESESVTMDKVVQTVFDLIENGAHNE